MSICLVLLIFYSIGKVNEEKEMDKKETFQLCFSMDNDIIA
jgi:hypothetical protein